MIWRAVVLVFLLMDAWALPAVTPDKSTLVKIYIPGYIVLNRSPDLKLRIKGTDPLGSVVYTGNCHIRVTVFSLDGAGIIMYPNSKTLCDQRLIGINAKKGIWSEISIPLNEISRFNLEPGRYMLNVHIQSLSKQNRNSMLSMIFVSNTATLDVK